MIVEVRTPCRLHFGLIDLNGSLGRINGGLGVALDFPRWTIQGKIIPTSTTEKQLAGFQPLDNISSEALDKFDHYFGVSTPRTLHLRISSSLLSHVGFGSKTQYLLALGSIAAKLHALDPPVREIAKAVQRGGTSGIGVAAFEAGGIILDGGHSFGPGKQTTSFQPSSISTLPPPPVLIRHNPPEDWLFVILTPKGITGSHGSEEVTAFRDSCPIPASTVEKLSRLILVKILPALLEGDIDTFGEGITEMQTNFTRFGMIQNKDSIITKVITLLAEQSGAYGYGISSFGPTMYALTNSKRKADQLISTVQESFPTQKFSLSTVSSVNTTGAQLRILDDQ